MCAALAVDAGARREGEKISIGTWTTNSSQGCCRLEEEPGNVIKAACVDTFGSKRHECDIYWLFTTCVFYLRHKQLTSELQDVVNVHAHVVHVLKLAVTASGLN